MGSHWTPRAVISRGKEQEVQWVVSAKVRLNRHSFDFGILRYPKINVGQQGERTYTKTPLFPDHVCLCVHARHDDVV